MTQNQKMQKTQKSVIVIRFYSDYTTYITRNTKNYIHVARQRIVTKIKHVRKKCMYLHIAHIHTYVNLNIWRQISFINPLLLPNGAKVFLHLHLNFRNHRYFFEFVEKYFVKSKCPLFLEVAGIFIFEELGCIMKHEGLTRPANLSCSIILC